jgi:hypothetical protein
MIEPSVLVHKSTYTTAEMVSTEDGGLELRVITNIAKLKEDYPFGLPNTIKSHIPMVMEIEEQA